MAYSQITDLLIGDTRVAGVIDPQAYVNMASDEIDAAIGNLYDTPIEFPTDDAASRPSSLLLKQINNYIATGRILLTLSRTAEDKKLDSLGQYYVKLGVDALNKIANGDVVLIGVTRNPVDAGPVFTGPRTVNSDPESLVDMFYEKMNPANPDHYWPDYSWPKRQGSTL